MGGQVVQVPQPLDVYGTANFVIAQRMADHPRWDADTDRVEDGGSDVRERHQRKASGGR